MAEDQTAGPKPSGIGGWLIFPAIGLILGPLYLLYGQQEQPARLQMVPVGSLVQIFLIFEVAGTLALIALLVYTAVRFFGRKADTRRLYLVFLLAYLAFTLVDAALASVILHVPMLDLDSLFITVPVAFICAVWIPYFLVSKRVRNTFVR